MALPKQLFIKESIKELRTLQKNQTPLIIKRLNVLIAIKKAGSDKSRRTLSEELNVSPTSIDAWRDMYEKGGIDLILKHKKTGFKKSIISEPEHRKLEKLLNNSQNGIIGYVELVDWIKKEFNKDLLYITVVKYVQRHFGAKVKVALKSHIKKDEQAVEVFKKTSLKSARK